MSDLLTFSPPGALDTGTKSFAGAKAVFYDAGTTTPRTVYTDQAESVPAASPLVADAAGLWPEVFASGGAVKVVVTYSDDTTAYTLDPCLKVAASGAGAAGVSFAPTIDIPATNVQQAIELAAASAASGFTPFGLGVTGSVALIANIDATGTATGQYRFDATTTGTYPTGVVASDTGAVMIVRETSGTAWMWLYHDTTDRVFIRRMTTSVWGAWRENITANIGAAEGDILYRSATAWTRLAKGTAAQVLQMNAGATAPEWAAASSPVKAWVNFNGTGTVAIRASENVSSITDNGVGDYTVNFTTAMPDANYATACSAFRSSLGSRACIVGPVAQTTSAVQINVHNDAGIAEDSTLVCVAIFR